MASGLIHVQNLEAHSEHIIGRSYLASGRADISSLLLKCCVSNYTHSFKGNLIKLATCDPYEV